MGAQVLRYQDRDTGEVFAVADLKCQYQTYVDDLRDELPEVQACSYAHWLRGEMQDRLRTYSQPELGDQRAVSDGSNPLLHYVISSHAGRRMWHAETMAHAVEQHIDALPDEPVLDIDEQGYCGNPAAPEKCH